jgi:hypothetical protein
MNVDGENGNANDFLILLYWKTSAYVIHLQVGNCLNKK